MKTIWTRAALKELEGLPKVKQVAVRDAVLAYAADPFGRHPNAKALIGVKNAVRLRVGDWRVVVMRSGDMLEILRVAHRREVYR